MEWTKVLHRKLTTTTLPTDLISFNKNNINYHKPQALNQFKDLPICTIIWTSHQTLETPSFNPRCPGCHPYSQIDPSTNWGEHKTIILFCKCPNSQWVTNPCSRSKTTTGLSWTRSKRTSFSPTTTPKRCSTNRRIKGQSWRTLRVSNLTCTRTMRITTGPKLKWRGV